MASVLAERFWPGPLTLVLSKRLSVPSVTTGGLDTVAVRVPAHPVALALITAAGVPLSAPSANPFMGVSPTRASDVDPGLAEIVLDGGPCEVGLESTVVDLTGDVPRVLRPGAISAEEISAVLGISVSLAGSAERRSPGLYPRHYAPNAPVRIVDRVADGDRGIVLGSPAAPGQISLPPDPRAYGAGLYAALHDLDRRSSAPIYVEAPPDTTDWDAVWDRLRRAATKAQNRR